MISARTGLVSAVVLALGISITLAALASPTARLVYVRGSGAESCPDEEGLKQAVATRLGYDPFRPFVANTLFAEIRRADGRFIGTVRVVDDHGIEQGARKLESRASDCNEIAGAMALSISIAIDPKSAFRAPAADAGSATDAAASQYPTAAEPIDAGAASEPPPATPVVEEVPPPPAPPVADPIRFGLGGGLHGSLGLGVAPTAGAHLSAEVQGSAFSTALELRADLPARKDTSPGALRSWMIGGALVPCVRVSPASICGVVLVSRLTAETVDVAQPRSDAFPFIALGGRLMLDLPLSTKVLIRPRVELLGAVTPYSLEDQGVERYASPTLSGSAGATVVYFF